MKQKIFILLLSTALAISCKQKKKDENLNPASLDSSALRKTSPFMTSKNEDVLSKYPNGRLKIKGQLKDGKREGLWISWYENGQEWSETMYEDGMKNGTTVSWHENGMKRYMGFYKNDIKVDKWTYWDDRGEMTMEESYSSK